MRHGGTRPSISVVIPTLDEVERIGGTLRACLQAAGPHPPLDLIVVDGGSTDGTREAARDAGATTVLLAPRGRGPQMNRGAFRARGDVLLFLHADTRLPEGWPEAVAGLAERPGVAAGAFTFRLEGPGAWKRVLERVVAWRCRYLQLPYGDQCLFVRREVFDAAGGYGDLRAMEDFDLVRRLRAQGAVKTLPLAAVTSPRRWEARGGVRLTAVHLARTGLWIAGARRRFRISSP